MHQFIIAEWLVIIKFLQDNAEADISLLPSFLPFRVPEDVNVSDYKRLLTFTVDLELQPRACSEDCHVRTFDTGNAHISVYRLNDGAYQYIIYNMQRQQCALLILTDNFSHAYCNIRGTHSMRSFGLNNAIMLSYALAGALHQTLLIHASLVRADGYAYAFIARSGTGKSTQTANWLKTIPNADLMNDDNPVIRIIDSTAIAFGSPWSGKTPCYRQTSAPLAAITQISRSEDNRVEQLSPIQAFTYILPSCSTMKWEHCIHQGVCDTISQLISSTPAYILHCTKYPESAIVCHESIARK